MCIQQASFNGCLPVVKVCFLKTIGWMLGRIAARWLPNECHSSMHVIIFVRHTFFVFPFLLYGMCGVYSSISFICCRSGRWRSKIGNSKVHSVSKTCHGNKHLYDFVKFWMQIVYCCGAFCRGGSQTNYWKTPQLNDAQNSMRVANCWQSWSFRTCWCCSNVILNLIILFFNFFLIFLCFLINKLNSLSEWSNPMLRPFEVLGWIGWTVCNMNQLCNPPSGFHGNLFNIFFANFKLNMNDSTSFSFNPCVEGVRHDVDFLILLKQYVLFMAWILLGWHQNHQVPSKQCF